MSRYREGRLDCAPVLSAAEIADALDRQQAIYTEMGEATLAGDTERCSRAARRLDAYSFGPEVNIKLCTDMAKVVALTWAGKRLRATRAREGF